MALQKCHLHACRKLHGTERSRMDCHFSVRIRVQCVLLGMVLPMPPVVVLPLLKPVPIIATIVTCGHSPRRVKCSGNTRDRDSIASTTPTSDRFPATGGPDAVSIHGLACPYMSLADKKHSGRFYRPIFLDVSKR